MGKNLIIPEHELLQTLQHASDVASVRQWQQQQHNGNGHDSPLAARQVHAILEQAAENPLGLHLLARRIICGEDYEKLSRRPFPVTTHSLTPIAVRQRVHRTFISIRALIDD